MTRPLMISALVLALAASASADPATATKASPAKRAPPVAASPPPAAPSAVQIAQGVQAFYEKTAGFQAAFTQVVKKKGLKKGITRKGMAWLMKGGKTATGEARNGRMRWDYPSEEVYYFSDGDVLWSYERRERLAIRVPVTRSRLYQATTYLVGDGALSSDFAMKVVDSPLPSTWALELVPKDGTQVMRSLTLVVDRATFAVRGSVLIDPLGDSTTLLFEGVQHGPIDDKVFEWSPPKGVTVKRL